jgi:hypothetical protein
MYRDRLDIFGLGSTDTLDRVCIRSGSKLVLLPLIYSEAPFAPYAAVMATKRSLGVSMFVSCLLIKKRG